MKTYLQIAEELIQYECFGCNKPQRNPCKTVNQAKDCSNSKYLWIDEKSNV